MFIVIRGHYINKVDNPNFLFSRVMPLFQLGIFTEIQLFGTIKGVNQILSLVFTWNLVHMLIVSRGHLIIKTDNPKFLFSRVMPLFQLRIFTKMHLFGTINGVYQNTITSIHLKLGTHVYCNKGHYIQMAANQNFFNFQELCPFFNLKFS